MISPTIVRLSIIAVGLNFLSSCACDKDDLPQYRLTEAEQTWTAPYTVNTEWRFRNAAGYERVYRVTKRADDMEESGGGKSSSCPSYYRQAFSATLQRIDSVGSPISHQLIMQASTNNSSLPFAGSLSWNWVQFTLAIDRVKSGGNIGYNCELLPQLTVGTKTYQQVLKSTSLTGSALIPLSTDAKVIYLTSDAGIIRVEEWGGTVWDRQ
ncbi:hypothetical protein Q5H93_11490 [Hymenobacter sp. ASUV-10]|uniref:Lipoprotein n=1 Tax=Hymenobacter aranciens TaxID=3063996 RepID=A0ABT9BAQ9_9BACT|nr:hypothetical protein [Hymenobacter sp. ASUV-10]MDO7875354.1 hypothetical protein [Hymenobacter sp. ASUV-10]